jgi:hypothetical protein
MHFCGVGLSVATLLFAGGNGQMNIAVGDTRKVAHGLRQERATHSRRNIDHPQTLPSGSIRGCILARVYC